MPAVAKNIAACMPAAVKIIVAMCFSAAALLLLLSCAAQGDVPDVSSGDTVLTEPPSASDTGSQQITAPETVPESEPETAPETEAPDRDEIMELLSEMTLEEKIGQLFLVRCDTENAVQDVTDYNLGGLVLFAADFDGRSPEEAAAAVASYQAAAKIPLLIAVDEEGGTVVRVSKYRQYRAQPFKSPSALYREGGADAVLSDIDEKSALLHSLGINCNLAPVCDVSADPASYIYPRTLGLDASATADVIAAMTERYTQNGMGCVLKHFPGYGGNSDTHEGISVDTREFEALEKGDLLPFKAGIAAGAGAVMVSHNIVKCIDPDYPSSLSPKVHSLLRGTLGFGGVIITDALDMGAIKEFSARHGGSPAVLAILAGSDIICSSDFKQMYAEVTAAVADGTIPASRIDESAERVLRWKSSLGLFG